MKNIEYGDGNLFESFYKDKTANSFVFQLAVYLARIKQIQDLPQDDEQIYIIERSPCNTIQVFGGLLEKEGALSSSQQAFMVENALRPPYGKHRVLKVLLQVEPSVAIARFVQRESDCSPEMQNYLHSLVEQYSHISLCNCKDPIGCANWHSKEAIRLLPPKPHTV